MEKKVFIGDPVLSKIKCTLFLGAKQDTVFCMTSSVSYIIVKESWATLPYSVVGFWVYTLIHSQHFN